MVDIVRNKNVNYFQIYYTSLGVVTIAETYSLEGCRQQKHRKLIAHVSRSENNDLLNTFSYNRLGNLTPN